MPRSLTATPLAPQPGGGYKRRNHIMPLEIREELIGPSDQVEIYHMDYVSNGNMLSTRAVKWSDLQMSG